MLLKENPDRTLLHSSDMLWKKKCIDIWRLTIKLAVLWSKHRSIFFEVLKYTTIRPCLSYHWRLQSNIQEFFTDARCWRCLHDSCIVLNLQTGRCLWSVYYKRQPVNCCCFFFTIYFVFKSVMSHQPVYYFFPLFTAECVNLIYKFKIKRIGITILTVWLNVHIVVLYLD